jgi:RNA polymerase sigma-70 factor, ECF subfamily
VSNRLLESSTAPGVGESFDEAVLPHLDAASRLARWLMRNEHDAEDVVQEASLRALRYFRTFTGGNGRAWFLRIVRNTCWSRRAQRFEALTDPFDEEQYSGARPASDPETLSLRTDDTTLIQQAMSHVPERFCELLVLRELEGLSYRELAGAMGIPMGTVMHGPFRDSQDVTHQPDVSGSSNCAWRRQLRIDTTGDVGRTNAIAAAVKIFGNAVVATVWLEAQRHPGRAFDGLDPGVADATGQVLRCRERPLIVEGLAGQRDRDSEHRDGDRQHEQEFQDGKAACAQRTVDVMRLPQHWTGARRCQRRTGAASSLGYCCCAAGLSPTVMSGLSFRKLFSPMPLTFISSSISFCTIVRAMFMRVNSRCAHHLRPPPE